MKPTMTTSLITSQLDSLPNAILKSIYELLDDFQSVILLAPRGLLMRSTKRIKVDFAKPVQDGGKKGLYGLFENCKVYRTSVRESVSTG
jgi:hypothetical protein